MFTMPDVDVEPAFTNTRKTHTVTVSKSLSPTTDGGKFDLQINATTVATAIGNGGTGNTAGVAVGGTITIAELGNATALGNYTTAVSCAGATVTPGSANQSGTFAMPDADVTCTFTNTRKANLTIAKNSNGDWAVGQAGAQYMLTVTNSGGTATSGTIAVQDTLPTGFSAAVAFTSGAWTCATSAANISCTSTTSLTIGGSDTITVPVTIGALAVPSGSLSATATNNASVGGGGDPANGGTPPTPGAGCAPADHCASKTNTVTSVADMSAVLGNMPSVLSPAEVVTNLTLTCTNVGASTAVAATCAPSVNTNDSITTGISALSCHLASAPATPISPPVAVAAGDAIVCNFTYTVPANGSNSIDATTTVAFTGTTSATNDSITSNNTSIAGAEVIDAVNDSEGPFNSALGGLTPTVLANDTVGGNPVNLGTNASLTPGASPNAGLVMNPDGTISVTAGTPPGPYTYPYTICSIPATIPTTCDTAIATVVVAAPGATTVTKTAIPASGTTVAPNETITYTLTAVVITNTTTQAITLTDTLSANQTFGTLTPPPTGGCTTGAIVTCTLPAGSKPGTYTFTYTATVNATATGTVGNSVTATNPPNGDPDPACASCTTSHPVIDAVDDSYGPYNGAAGGTTGSVITNDTVGGAAAVIGTNVTLTPGASPVTGLTMNGDGTIAIAAGTAAGTYNYHYTICALPVATPTACDTAIATVKVSSPGATTISKSSIPATGTQVGPGQTITYTLSATIANNPTTQVVTLTDTLSGNQTFGTLTPPTTGSCTTAPTTVTCTLPAGSGPGTYTFTYTATVNANATGTVGNEVVPTKAPGNDPEPVCSGCTTSHDVIDAVDDAYGPYNSAVGGVTGSVIVNDTVAGLPAVIGTNVTLTPDAPPVAGLTMNAAGVITVSAGTTPGMYAYTYTICVLPATTPTACDTATAHVSVDAAGTTAVSKTSSPATGTVVEPGQAITYTLTAVVTTNTTSEDITLTDSLSANQTFGALTAPAVGSCTTGATIVCTLPAGTDPGTYTFTYTATVKTTATGTVGNSVTATNPPGGDPDPSCATCTTGHDVIDANDDTYGSYNSAVGGITGSVLANDTVGGALAVIATNVTLTAGSSPVAGMAMNADGTIAIAAGTVPGTYVYPYMICSTAVPTSCDTASATVTVAAPGTTAVSKTSNPTSGTVVAPAQTITYTLTAVVSTNTTTQDITLTDTLSANQTFGTLTAPTTGACTTGAIVVCTLPANTVPGTYTFTYTATVNANATGTVGNSVTATNPPNGDPDPACASCTTSHPVIDAVDDIEPAINSATGGNTASVIVNDTIGANPVVIGTNATLTPGSAPVPAAGSLVMNADGTITVAAGTTPGPYTYPYTICSIPATTPTTCDTAIATIMVTQPGATTVTKTALPASGTTVAPNETITYTLTAVVSTNTTTQDITLTDTLSANQTFGTLTAPTTGACTTGAIVVCTLPAGTKPGTYTFTYTATVNATATGTVGNSVTATNPPNGDPDPACTSCTTSHPVFDAVDDNEGAINSAVGGTTGSVIVNDTVGGNPITLGTNASLTPGTSPNAGLVMNPDGTITVAPGTTPGPYLYPYTICSIPATTPATCDTATATLVVAAPGATTVTKTAIPASGTTVAPNETISYTLTAVVSTNTTTQAITLTDTLSANQTFGTLTPPPTGACTTGAIVVCTLPAGTVPGTYTFTYTASVNTNATGTVGNNVTATNPPNGDPDPACASCTTTHPVIDAVDDNEGTINTATGGTTPTTVLVNDTVGGNPVNLGTNASLTPGASPNAGLVMNADGTITVAPGTTPNTYLYPYTICSIPATIPVTCDTAIATVVVAAPGATTVTKTAIPASGTTVAPNETISYTLTAVVITNTTTQAITLTDTLSANQTFGTLTPPPTGACTTGAIVVCTLPAGTVPGTYTFTYTATVNTNATGTVGNNVTATNPPNGDPDPACASCTTTHPVIDAVDDSFGAINPASGGTTLTVLANDTVGGNPLSLGTNASLTPGTSPNAGLVMNPDGTITVAPGTPSNTYLYPYTICSIPATTPVTCDTATATVVVLVPDTRGAGLDPPFITKSVGVVDAQTLTWTIVVDNNANSAVQNSQIRDPMPAGMTFLSGQVTCTTFGSSTVSDCFFDAANNRVVADAVLASDLGNPAPATAPNRVVITFEARFTTGPIPVTNTASACWDAQNNTTNVTACTTSQTATAQYAPLPEATPVPVNSRWLLALMAMLMSCVGAWGLRRRGVPIR